MQLATNLPDSLADSFTAMSRLVDKQENTHKTRTIYSITLKHLKYKILRQFRVHLA